MVHICNYSCLPWSNKCLTVDAKTTVDYMSEKRILLVQAPALPRSSFAAKSRIHVVDQRPAGGAIDGACVRGADHSAMDRAGEAARRGGDPVAGHELQRHDDDPRLHLRDHPTLNISAILLGFFLLKAWTSRSIDAPLKKIRINHFKILLSGIKGCKWGHLTMRLIWGGENL